MLGSKFMDLVLGVDIHTQVVTTPAGPVPVPLPTPFVGMIFDPAQLASMALGSCPAIAAIGIALDPIGSLVSYVADKIEGVDGGLVLINGVPATNTMTQVTTRYGMPHPVTPPAAMFLRSGNPTLQGDAVYNLGSSSVWLNKRRAVRALIDPAFTCSDPMRLPTGVTVPVPLGAPVLIGGAPTPDLQAMVSRSLRNAATRRLSRAVSRPLRRLIARIPSRRLRQLLSTYKCFATGDPVDVATGRMFTTATDWELPGPIPLSFTREYSSVVSDRDGSLGFGWSHTLDEEVWLERGRVVFRGGDGREIQFDTMDLPGRQMRLRDELFEPVNRLRLRCVRDGWDVENTDGHVREFRLVREVGKPARFRLCRIRSRDRHEIVLEYDQRARLTWARDSEGRIIRFEYNAQDRLARVLLPHPTQPGFVPHVSYEYSTDGNLVAVRDALGNVARYGYSGHLMVQRTDRTGFSFYFGYDGLDASAFCVRTWGDQGILDHELVYDKEHRRTFVTDSLGATTIYEMNEALLVAKITDARGGTTQYEYDDQLREVCEIDPLGAKTTREYDARGNCVRIVEPGGAERRMTYDERDLCTSAADALGAEHRWEYDSMGRLLRSTDPVGQGIEVEYEAGRVASVRTSAGQATYFAYDTKEYAETVTLPNGAKVTRRRDALGRIVEERDARGGVRHFRYTALGDLHTMVDALGLISEYNYDAERNLVEASDSNRRLKLTYGGFHRVVAREEAGARVTFEYDTQDRLVVLENEAGERYQFTFDSVGDVCQETGFDGGTRTYSRDAAGRITKMFLPSTRWSENTYDAAGRLSGVKHSDGTYVQFAYDKEGRLVESRNESSHVLLERDSLGRVVRESQDGGATWVRSTYAAAGVRALLESDLGARQRVELDELGAIRALVHGSPDESAVVRFERDAFGLESARELLGGVRVAWKRDAEGRPTERSTTKRRARRESTMLTHRGPSSALLTASDSPELLDGRSYEWRGRDQISALMSTATGTTFYDHDARGRLVRERRPAEQRVVERAMDVVGNVYRTEEKSDRHYAKGGRILQADGIRYEHDADGNLVRKMEPNGRAWVYRWNGSGMLSEVEKSDGQRVRFEYDVFARRTKKVVASIGVDGAETVVSETRFVWDGQTILHEVDADENATTWYWEPGTFTPVMKVDGSRKWSVASDHLGTPTEMYDETGKLAWRMQLDAFGVPAIDRVGSLVDAIAVTCPWRLTGQYFDDQIGLSYSRWRYYDPNLGGFISRDPLGIRGGYGAYGYADDSVLEADPLGLSPGDYRVYQIHSPGGGDLGQKGLHFYSPIDRLELSVRPDHQRGITFVNAIPNDRTERSLPRAIAAAQREFERNPDFRLDILEKARAGVQHAVQEARGKVGSLRDQANGRSRELITIARNVERYERNLAKQRARGNCTK